MRRSTVLSLPLQQEFRGRGIRMEMVVSELQISLLMAMWAVDCVFTLNFVQYYFLHSKIESMCTWYKTFTLFRGQMYKNVHP